MLQNPSTTALSPAPVMCGATESRCGRCSPTGNTLMESGQAHRSVLGVHVEYWFRGGCDPWCMHILHTYSMSDPCEDTYTLSVYAVFTYVHALQSLSSALNVRGRYKWKSAYTLEHAPIYIHTYTAIPVVHIAYCRQIQWLCPQLHMRRRCYWPE